MVEYKYSSLENGFVGWIVCQSATQPIWLWSHLFWLKFRDSPHPFRESRDTLNIKEEYGLMIQQWTGQVGR